MGKMFSKLKTDGLEESGDRLGGYQALPTDYYLATIKLAYVTESSGGATAVNLVIEANGSEARFQEYVTNREGDNFYYDKQDKKKKHPLPSFTTINDICLLTTGEELSDQDVEEKVVKQYDPAERKEVNKPAPVLVDLIGKQVGLAISRDIVFKQKKNDSGNYVDTNETRTENTISKAFDAETHRTVTEHRQEVDSDEFRQAWLKQYQGKDNDKTKGKAAASGSSGTGRPGGDAGTGEKKKSLFSKA